MSQIEFISKIEKVSNLANNFSISIFNIPAFTNQKIKQLTDLDKEIAIKQRQIKQIIEEYDLTIQDLKDYRLNRPLIDKIQKLEYMLQNKEKEKSWLIKDLIDAENENSDLRLKKTVQEKELIEANKKLPSNNPIGIKELSKITDEFFSHPSKNVDIIKLMRERYLRNPN